MSTAIEERNKFSEQGRQVPGTDFIAVGRKGRDFIVRTQQTLLAEFVNYGDRPTIGDASAIAQVAVDFLKEEVDVVFLAYPRFVNTVTQQPIAIQLLPVQPPSDQSNDDAKTKNTSTSRMLAASSRPCCRAMLMCWSSRPCWRLSQASSPPRWCP